MGFATILPRLIQDRRSAQSADGIKLAISLV